MSMNRGGCHSLPEKLLEGASKTVIKPKETNNRASTSSQGSAMAGSVPEEGAGFLALGLF